MAAYSRVYDLRHLQADCKEPGLAPEPYATFLHVYLIVHCVGLSVYFLYDFNNNNLPS